jgi:hypothetical protein
MSKRFLGLTVAQERALSLIAINMHPFASPKTIQVLLDQGLIIKGERTIYGKGHTVFDRIPMVVEDYTMPIAVHYAWCKWCSEHEEEQ